MSSYTMLSDENALNNINPFVSYEPGTSNKPYGFAPSFPDKEQIICDSYGCSVPSSQTKLEQQSYIEKNITVSPWEPSTKTPLCSWGINARTNGSIDAPRCLPAKNPVSCPLSRPLEPTQEFIPDLYTLKPYKEPVPKELLLQSSNFLPMIGVLFIIGVLLTLVKR